MNRFIFILSFLITSISMYAGKASMIIEVEAGETATICYGETLELSTLGASISGDVTDGLWFSYGDGVFLPGSGTNGVFSTTTQYQPGLQDQANGSFTLILVSDDPDGNGPMVEVSDEVTINFMNAPALVCNNSINVSLSEGCQQAVDVTMLLANPFQPYDKYQIELQDENGNIIADNLLTVDHIGMNISFEVSHDCTNSFCDGTIVVSDNIAPFLNCIDTEADCEGGVGPESTGFPIPFYATATQVDDNTYTVADFDDCSEVTLSYSDVEQQMVCSITGFVKEITRTWSATDEAGNTSLCEQSILVRPLMLADVELPPNYDGVALPPLSCDGDWPMLDNGYPSPDTTGMPAFAACGNIESTYTDVLFDECGAGFKIVRQWFIIDWCMSGNNSITHNQIIKILDTEGPIFDCPADLTLDSKAYTCVNAVYELTFAEGGADCSDFSGSYKILTLDNEDITHLYLDYNTIEDLPVGEYILVYVATDECGNASECPTTLMVEDTSAPFAVCDGFTKISVSSNGMAELFATSVDDDSFDNCGEITMEIAKMTDECSWGLDFSDRVHFCCEEIGDSVLVAFRVTDNSGLSNTCMVTVHVEDKLPPVLECPSDLTVSCNFAFDLEDLDVFGQVTEGDSPVSSIVIDGLPVGQYGYFYDNCDADVSHTFTSDIDCGEGTIIRTFTATDAYGQSTTCNQTITLVNDNPFLESDISWPSNFVMFGCDTVQAHPSVTGEPILGSGKCGLVESTYEDQIFSISDSACIKILREWTVIDWCQYDPSTGIGLWTYYQEVKLKNNVAPVFISCDDQQACTYDDDCQSGLITITALVNDDCTDSLDLLYLWELDLDDDGVIDESSSGISFDRELDLGGHRVYWIVEDGCGNEVRCNYMINVRDCKNPTPYCNSSITTTIMPEAGEIDIWAIDFDYGSTDNCTASEDLNFSFSQDLNDNRRVITCDSIENGVAQVFTYNMYVTDEWGNQERCSVKFIVQDNADWCENGTIKGKIAGHIKTQKNKNLPDAEIDIVASIDTFSGFEMTDEEGAFQYEETPELLSYTLRPHYNSSARSGVSTLDLVMVQRHILGTAPFDNPYDIIASDVNKNDRLNGSDLLTLRKMILGITAKWPKEIPNWRFVDSSYVFEDIEDPFVFPDSVVIERLMDTTHAIQFVAIKMGDVNGSYDASLYENGDNISARSNQAVNARWVNKADDSFDLFIDTDRVVDGLQMSIEIGDRALISSSILSADDYVITDGVLKISWVNTSNIALQNVELLSVDRSDTQLSFTPDIQAEVYIDLEAYNLELKVEQNNATKTDSNEDLIDVLGNPFENELRIRNRTAEPLLIELYNSEGALICNLSLDNQSNIIIPTYNLESGIYILKSVQEGATQVERVIRI